MIADTNAAAPLPRRTMLRLGLRLVFGALVILAVQGTFWLREGHWVAFDLRDVLQQCGAAHLAAGSEFGQSLLALLLGCPLSGLFGGLGFVLAGLGAGGRAAPR